MARDVLLTARILDVGEAEAVGLVQRRSDDALRGAVELAEVIARLAPLSVAGHKQALNLVAAAHALSPAMRDRIQSVEAAAFASNDLQEGLAAFAEKRDPNFEGH
jgi:enoyl-CoA hydratase/carnithine racemase